MNIESKNPFQETNGDSYKKLRPGYSPKFIKKILSQTIGDGNSDKSGFQILDLGTGNGQIAIELAKLGYCNITATDPSEDQISSAYQDKAITYELGNGETTGKGDSSFDLVTVGGALHRFNHDLFFQEMNRILKPGGYLAVCAYQVFKNITTQDRDIQRYLNELFNEVYDLYDERLKKYIYHDNINYQNIKTPLLSEIEYGIYPVSTPMTIEQFGNLINTMSFTKEYAKKYPSVLLGNKIKNDLAKYKDNTIQHHTDLFYNIWQKN